MLFVGGSRNGIDGASPATTRKTERRFADEIREQLDIDPSALTASEAAYVLNFRDADALRDTGAKARSERSLRLDEEGTGAQSDPVREFQRQSYRIAVFGSWADPSG